MPRPKRNRRIRGYPDYWTFSPEGSAHPETLLLSLDEYEAIRVIDFLRMTQEECAAQMGVSRSTVTSIYDSARSKLADALVNGKRIRIAGGAYRIDDVQYSHVVSAKDKNVKRIAVTYNQELIGQHFGRTEQFKIYDILDALIKDEQIIDTDGTGHGALVGFLRAAEVDVLICGGIGFDAKNSLEDAGIRLVTGVTGREDDAIRAWLSGNLQNDPDSVCRRSCGCRAESNLCGGCNNNCASQSSDWQK
ncbi:MAG: DUF134 domain-containing protein [Lachnospiraceae bacterium]|nr:DUF134 domain-containing protein [Lachnospiraceae bacterium]MBQ1575957.1 DUF134 domain-containing protein [Oscillospiraceae bacterium]